MASRWPPNRISNHISYMALLDFRDHLRYIHAEFDGSEFTTMIYSDALARRFAGDPRTHHRVRLAIALRFWERKENARGWGPWSES